MAQIANLDSQPVLGEYGSINWIGQKGCLLSAGTLPGTKSALSMDINPANGLSLQYDVPGVKPTLRLNAQGAEISVGPPGIGAEAKLTPAGITLQFGPPGAGATLTLDASGITLKAGPTTSVQLTPAGINLNGLALQLNADAVYQLSAKMLTESVTGIVNRSAAMQKIG
jgi:hypothetical protein